MPEPPRPNPKPGGPSSSGDVLANVTHEYSLATMSVAKVRGEIESIEVDDPENRPRVRVTDADAPPHALMRWSHPVKMQIDGPLGDYSFAHSSDCDVLVRGHVGHGFGESLRGGAIRVRGNAGVGVGAAMTGGTLAIYGNASHRTGANMRSGEIFVRGNVGDDVGLAAVGGTIVIGGNAGERLGHGSHRLTIFIRGAAKSLATGMTETGLRKREKLRLGLLLINASIRGDADEFRRIIATPIHDAEQAARGEINPSWR